MKFQFRLARIQKLVELDESAKKIQVAAALRKIIELQTERENHVSTVRELLKNRQSAHRGSDWFEYDDDAVSWGVNRIKLLDKQIMKARDSLVELRKVLEKATQKRRALEELGERRRLEHRKARSKREAQKMEELFRYAKAK